MKKRCNNCDFLTRQNNDLVAANAALGKYCIELDQKYSDLSQESLIQQISQLDPAQRQELEKYVEYLLEINTKPIR